MHKAKHNGIFLPRPSYLLPWSPQEANGSRARGPGCWCRIPGCDMGYEEGAFPAEAGEGAQILATREVLLEDLALPARCPPHRLTVQPEDREDMRTREQSHHS